MRIRVSLLVCLLSKKIPGDYVYIKFPNATTTRLFILIETNDNGSIFIIKKNSVEISIG
jgi:hypothetical protein